MKYWRLSSIAVLAWVAALAQAEIVYTVQALPDAKRLDLTIEVPKVTGSVELQMPNWAPGSYRLVDNWKNVQEFSATDGGGQTAKIDKPNDYTWKLSGADGTFKVKYSIPNTPTDGVIHFSGPSTYLYVIDRKTESCRLRFQVPGDEWPIELGLDEDPQEKGAYLAPDYDVLADNPVSMGAFLRDTYTVGGKPHIIVYRGEAKSQVDRAYVIKACKAVTEMQIDFFGNQPYNKYVWHFSVRPGADGAGGLEHLSSTQMSIAAGIGPSVVHVMSHEFFHLWNVKRIRSKPLGPFDYTQLPKTGALWWLEGVTDYYSVLLLARYKWDTEERFYQDMLRQVDSVRANAARMEVSPYDASYRVGEAANGRGNSNGYRISYYTTGWLCGLVLDLEIRHRSGGKHSLDDVMLALWDLCKDDRPGFEEDEIRKQCIRFGGPTLGEFYDRVIRKPGELPVEEQLAKAGLQIGETDEKTVAIGFAFTPVRDRAALRVRRVDEGAKGVLEEGDLILAIEGKDIELQNFARGGANPTLPGAKVGTPIKLKIEREGKAMDVEITPREGVRKIRKILPMSGADPGRVKFRNDWIYGGK